MGVEGANFHGFVNDGSIWNLFWCFLCTFNYQNSSILKTLGQFENLGFLIMSTRENIHLIARPPKGKTHILKLNVAEFFLLNAKDAIFDPTTSNICLLNFVDSLNPDQAKNVRHNLDPYCLALYWYSWKIFWKQFIWKENSAVGNNGFKLTSI